jgi:hypothetical protein
MHWTCSTLRHPRVLTLFGLVLLAQAGQLWSQPQQAPLLPQPRILILSPCGGKAGITVEVQVTGQDLDNAQGLLFSHPGIKAELAGPPMPAAKGKSEPPRKGPNQPPNTATVRFHVTIAADVPLGLHDLRLVNAWGVSNPRAFAVGDLQEEMEKEPNNDVEQAQKVPMNSTVNGTISAPTDVDYYSFAGKKGQRVVVGCLASSIDSRLQPGVELYGPGGELMAANRDYHDTDAVLDKVLPQDGDYQMRVFSFTYTRGGPEYFYRLSISTAPWIDAVFPPMVVPGQDNTLTVYGRNLPGGKPDPTAVLDGSVLDRLTINIRVPADPLVRQRLGHVGHVSPRSAALDGFSYTLRNESGQSNPYLLTYARAPIVLDQGDNDTAAAAQKITLPCEIAGRIEKVRDRDWYRFSLKKGETYVIEVFGDRIGSPVDMYFSLRPAEGKGPVNEYDDNPEVLHPQQFYTRTEDPQRVRFTAPADGDYLLQVSSRDADLIAGPRQLYRLSITPEQADYRLVLMPSASRTIGGELVRAGSCQYFTVLVARQDGFDGPITLTAEGLPVGVHCPAQTIGPGQKLGVLVVSADPGAAAWTGFVHVVGSATLDGQVVVREARSASIVWPSPIPQLNLPVLSRLDRGLALAVRDHAPFALKVKSDAIKALPGARVSLDLKLERLQADFKGPVQVTLPNWTPNLLAFNNNQPLNIAGDKGEAKAALDVRSGLSVGTYTLVLRVQGQVPFSRDPAGKGNKANLTAVAATLPITLTVTPKDAVSGALVITPGELTIQKGGKGEASVKLNRPGDLTGDLKVQVITVDAPGVTAEETVIPAGQNKATIGIQVAAQTNSGVRNLRVRVTGQGAGKVPVTHEGRLTVMVVRPPM